VWKWPEVQELLPAVTMPNQDARTVAKKINFDLAT